MLRLLKATLWYTTLPLTTLLMAVITIIEEGLWAWKRLLGH